MQERFFFQGFIFLEFNSKKKYADLTSEQSLKLGDSLNSVIISCVPSILASQNRFKSLYDEIFNIERFLE